MFNTYYLFAGNQVHFLTKAGQGDPDYKDFWDRHESETEDTTYKNIDDGLGLLLNDRIIMHVNDQPLRSFFNSNPFFHACIPKIFQWVPNTLLGNSKTSQS